MAPFDRFARAFSVLPSGQTPRPPFRDRFLTSARGYDELMERFAGCTFDDGLYRLFDASSGPKAAELARAFYPGAADRLFPFGMDWLGRIFALDRGRAQDGEPQIMLLEIGTGDSLEVPYGLLDFHDEHLTDDPEPALAVTAWEEWAQLHSDAVPLPADKCVGYELPLFLGGADTLDNMAVSAWEVYWTVVGQLKLRTAGLPEGAPLRDVGGG
jgi:hypothetical protein